ncbi:MAG: ABC transporter ATP-binding protein [Chlamydiae bacterium GWA2_50_15]|nr:MAG: ABC transporter ATP-binding protein [Chlamydiae bacterium GWA2_50_15]OGN54752.1 MAG: ABC transporter ATP-binding protein [Chlamydiae bacterium GWF2_49_8]OGN58213.1 MAG: ABC transporter ATP-binding protein [Chlamydiae bacterium RIFCSPHIGHO2_02_FULL_49_29]HCJ82927.1 ABC transporter ATP-binding protein [Parachlamydiales bacterium]
MEDATAQSFVLQADEIVKEFYSPVALSILKGVSLTARKGESIAIVGKSGIGKSTLLHILGTLERPTSGRICILGKSVSPSSACQLRREHIGFIFQAFHLFEETSVLGNVLMPAKIARQATHQKSSAYQRALLLLDEVGLKERADFPAKLLSGGEKQRTALARAFMNDPDLILADEPTGNLDQSHSQQINDLLLSATSKRDKTLIVVTHDQELAARCNRVYHLQDGQLTKEGF